MWSSIANLKENLNKIALDVHDDDDDDDDDEEGDLAVHGSRNGGGDFLDSDRRISNSFKYSRSPMANGVETPVNHEIERYKAEIKKLQESEAEIKALSVNYAALLKEKEDQISRLNKENGSLKQNLTSTNAALKDSRSELSRASTNYAIKGNSDHSPNRSQKSPTNWKSRNHMYNGNASKQNGIENDADSNNKEKEFADRLEERTRSMASAQARYLEKEREKLANLQISLQEERRQNESFKEELQYLRLDKEETCMESSKVRSELDAKLAEIKQLQMRLNGREQQAVGFSIENLKGINKSLEKENNELKLKRSELEAALEASQMSTNSKLFPEVTEALSRHPTSLDKENPESFPGKEDMEKSLQRLEKDLEEARREKDKARQELKRLKQHLLEKETEESEKMDEDSRLIEELRQANEYQRSQILGLEKVLKQAMASQEEIKSSNDLEIRKSNGILEDLNQKLANCLRTIDSKNVELLNLQTALGQYYAEIEAKEHFEQELAVAKEEATKLLARLNDGDERLESSKKEKEEATSKLLQAEKIAGEWKNRVSKVEEDNAKVRRVLEQSMTRLNRMSMDSDFLVDRRIVIKLLVTYFQRNHSREVLDLMVRMLGFSEEDKQRIGLAQQGAAGKGVVRGVLGLPGRLVGGILGGGSSASPDSHPNMASDNQSFADMWVDFLLKDAEERERRDAAIKEQEKASSTTQRPMYDQSDSEFSTVPLTSTDSNHRLSRLLT